MDGAARGDLRNRRIWAKNSFALSIFIPSNVDSLLACGLQCGGSLERDWGAFAESWKACRLWPECMCNLRGRRFTDHGFVVHLGCRLGELGMCELGCFSDYSEVAVH